MDKSSLSNSRLTSDKQRLPLTCQSAIQQVMHCREFWLAAENLGPFDLIFIDADKPGYPDYLFWALELSQPGSLIIADNVVRNGEVANAASTDPNVQGVRRYNALLAAEPRVTATVLQTVGSKGYDGLAVALVAR